MTSILTNTSAMAALGTLRSISSDLGTEQLRLSSGLRVGSAADNAAYWSIATTMRSDSKAIATVHDALGLSAAKIDMSFSAMSAVKDVLDEIKAKLVAALEPGIDKAKIQKEIDQLAASTRSIARSASFAGENWLDTDISGLIDTTLPLRSSTVVSSFNRSPTGNVSIGTATVDHLGTALFNSEGGGILEPDPRSPRSIAGMRYDISYIPIGEPFYSPTGYTDYHGTGGYPGHMQFTFSGPLDFATPADSISFDLTLDADNPSSVISAPFAAGQLYSVTIDRSVVDTVLPANGGKIHTAKEMAQVLQSQLAPIGAYAGTSYWELTTDPGYFKFHIYSSESNGLNGSAVQITNLASTVGSGGLLNGIDYGERGSAFAMSFEPFEVYQSVQIDFDFSFNEEAPTSHMINRALVNSVLGTTDGKIETSAQWAQILNTLITRPDTIIQATSATQVTVKTDPAVDRLNGSRTAVSFSNVKVNIEPLPLTGIFGIDIVANPNKVEYYVADVERMTVRVIDGAATLGALKARVDLQAGFTKSLTDVIGKGVARLVDADMNEGSTRVKALQTQQQLAIQALSIANSSTENIGMLFR